MVAISALKAGGRPSKAKKARQANARKARAAKAGRPKRKPTVKKVAKKKKCKKNSVKCIGKRTMRKVMSDCNRCKKTAGGLTRDDIAVKTKIRKDGKKVRTFVSLKKRQLGRTNLWALSVKVARQKLKIGHVFVPTYGPNTRKPAAPSPPMTVKAIRRRKIAIQLWNKHHATGRKLYDLAHALWEKASPLQKAAEKKMNVNRKPEEKKKKISHVMAMAIMKKVTTGFPFAQYV